MWCMKRIAEAHVRYTDLKHVQQMLVVLSYEGLLPQVEFIVSQLTDNNRSRPSLQQYEQLIRAGQLPFLVGICLFLQRQQKKPPLLQR